MRHIPELYCYVYLEFFQLLLAAFSRKVEILMPMVIMGYCLNNMFYCSELKRKIALFKM